MNVSQEASKHGVKTEDVLSFIHSLQAYSKIKVIGLMTMAPAEATEAEVLKYFKLLKHQQEEIAALNLPYAPCTELSMGMSQDYHVAIQAGATHIRLGSVLFAE